jgi:flagellar hook assembly protein FlgD
MKKSLLRITAVMLFIFLTTNTESLFSQTSGTFSFSANTIAPTTSSYGTSHLLALWLEDSQANYIKTAVKYLSGDYVHMQTWIDKSLGDATDAVTGATRTTYSTVSFLWDGKWIDKNLVPDGTYNVWIEMAWDNSLTIGTGKTVNSYSFVKGPGAYHSVPGNTVNFTSVSLDWTPLTTGMEGTLEGKDIIVFPNPSSGLLKINFKNPEKECFVSVLDQTGKVVYNENIKEVQAEIKTFDLTGLEDGNYFCSLNFSGKVVIFNLIIIK